MDNLKRGICEAFCAGVEVKPFAGGLAIGTPYLDRSGDRIGVYALGQGDGPFRLIDNALTISFLEAEGVNFDNASRRQTLSDLLVSYRAEFNEEMGEIFVDGVSGRDLPKAILNFSALLLRINDLIWLASDRVRGTFRDDIKELLRKEFTGKAVIKEDEPVSPALQEITPDMVFLAEGRDPVALFIVTDESKLWQAMHLRLIADYEQHVPLSVVAMLERESAVSSKVRIKADNRLDATPRYEDEPNIAIQRIAAEVLGRQVSVH